MNTDLMFSNNSNDWSTPQQFFDKLDEEFHFTLDPCADELNHKCEKYFTKDQDGLKQSWKGERVFCNPPYGRYVRQWVKKCAESDADLVVLLIFARTDTSYFHDYIYHKAEIRFLRGRLKFGNSNNNATAGSMLVIFRKGESNERLNECTCG